jgi:hypothetical protein
MPPQAPGGQGLRRASGGDRLMAARQRARTAAWDEKGAREVWVTVETDEGNAVGGVDGRFDFDSEEEAVEVVQKLAVEVGKPLSVVAYDRRVIATYAAVTRIEKI